MKSSHANPKNDGAQSRYLDMTRASSRYKAEDDKIV